jgi:hypothetical protein
MLIRTYLIAFLLLILPQAAADVLADGHQRPDPLPFDRHLSDYDTVFSQMGARPPEGRNFPLDIDLARNYVAGTTKRAALLKFSDEHFDHEVSVGTGGDVYSWTLNGKELLSPQDHWFSQWVDEVFQVVLSRRGEGRKRRDGGWRHNNPFFVHQAGAYADRRFEDRTNHYSHVLALEFEPSTGTLYILSWPQQAHVPEILRSDFLMLTRISRASRSMLAVDVLVFNHGSELIDWINYPWGGVRHSVFDQVNSWRREAGALSLPFKKFKDRLRLVDAENTGVFLWTQKSGGNLAGSLVYSTVMKRNEHETRGILRYGYGGGEHGWKQRDLFVTTAVGSQKFLPGDVLFARYYLGFGNRGEVEDQLSQNRFSGQLSIISGDQLAMPALRARLVRSCIPIVAVKALQRNEAGTEKLRDMSFDRSFRAGAHPVFLFDDDPRRPGAYLSSDIYFGARSGKLRVGLAGGFLQRMPVYRFVGYASEPVTAEHCPQYIE